MDTLVVIPTYDEADNVRTVVERVLSQPLGCSVVIVDDASPDGTGRIADDMARADPRVHVVHRPGKLGLGSALSAGMTFGLERGARRLITMDADLSHDPDYLPALVAGMTQADVMIGSRYVAGGGTRHWGLGRRVLSRTANLVARGVLGLPAHDCTAGLRCYGRHVLETIDLQTIRSNGYAYQEELLFRVFRAGFRVVETPIIFVDRRAGRSKISRHEVWRAMTTLVRLRFGG